MVHSSVHSQGGVRGTGVRAFFDIRKSPTVRKGVRQAQTMGRVAWRMCVMIVGTGSNTLIFTGVGDYGRNF